MDPIDEHEAYLVAEIRMIQQEYQKAIDPLVKELTRIRSLRPPPPLVIPLDKCNFPQA